MNTNKRLLLIGFVWPEPNSSAAGGRMMQLIALFQNQGFAITFASPALDSDFMVNLADYDVDKVSIALNDSSFDSYIKDMLFLTKFDSVNSGNTASLDINGLGNVLIKKSTSTVIRQSHSHIKV